MKMTDFQDHAEGYSKRPNPKALYNGFARLCSLVLAILLSLWLTLFPQSIVTDGQAPSHWLLLLCMWGIAGGFVHGVGFVPRNAFLRIVLGPVAAWLLMISVIVFILV